VTDRLRPLKVTEVVDRAFALYRENLWLFYAIVGCVYVPFGVLSVAFGSSIQKGGINPALEPSLLGAYFAMGGAVYIVFMMANGFAQATLAIAVADRYLDLPITFWMAYRRAISRWGAIVGAIVLTSLAHLVSLCLCVVPFFWLWMGLSLAPHAVVLESLPATQALTRSWHLSRGNRMRIFCMLLLMSVAFISVWGTVSFFAHLLFRSQLVAGIATQVGYSVVAPVMQVGLVIIYFDTRVRKEGFDLALLAAQLSPQRAAAPAPAKAW